MSGHVSGDDADWVRKYSAWSTAWPVPSYDPEAFRRDDYGNLISWGAFGDHSSPWGWEIDGGATPPDAARLATLRAIHWRTQAKLDSATGHLLAN